MLLNPCSLAAEVMDSMPLVCFRLPSNDNSPRNRDESAVSGS